MDFETLLEKSRHAKLTGNGNIRLKEFYPVIHNLRTGKTRGSWKSVWQWLKDNGVTVHDDWRAFASVAINGLRRYTASLVKEQQRKGRK